MRAGKADASRPVPVGRGTAPPQPEPLARPWTHKSAGLIDARLHPASGAKADIPTPPLRFDPIK